MDNIVYNTITDYYKLLQRRGYNSPTDTRKILVLCFYWNFMAYDYRGLISREDYLLIEKALNCLYGSTCLIPYPDYLKMNKLHLGSMSEMAQRVKTLEDTPVLKAFDADGTGDSDIVILADEED
jgi:hypothetical protein